jgi:hypothetical protein
LLEKKRWSIYLPTLSRPQTLNTWLKALHNFFWPGCYRREDWTSHPVRKDWWLDWGEKFHWKKERNWGSQYQRWLQRREK